MPPKPKTAEPKDTTPEAIAALGNCCLALSQAIAELARAGFQFETKKLVGELSLNSRTLRIKSGGTHHDSSALSQADADKWMADFLANGEKLAAEIIEEAAETGLSKSQIFKAKENLDLVVAKRGRLQAWGLSVATEAAPCTGDCE